MSRYRKKPVVIEAVEMVEAIIKKAEELLK